MGVVCMSNKDVLSKIKVKIKELIECGELEFAKELLEKYEDLFKDDVEIYSMKAIIAMMEDRMEEAEQILLEGYKVNKYSIDILYNLGFLYENKEKYNEALKFYKKAKLYCTTVEEDNELKDKLDDIIKYCCLDEKKEEKKIKDNQKRIVFFVKQGMDSFLVDIVDNLSLDYNVKQIIIKNNEDLKLIDRWMEWADICWFEWCDELVVYGSNLPIAKEVKIICRLHRYEVFTNYPHSVNWHNVDKLIVVTDHLKVFLSAQIPDIEKLVDIITVNNGVNLENYEFRERTKGFNIAYVGYIHQRKNPVLLLQIINKLVKIDKRYKLYIAGQFQDGLIKLYWDYQLKQMGLQDNVIFEGWQDDINKWLEDKNYIISTSMHESFGYGIAEAMARGLKPVVHDFIMSEEIWPKEYLFCTVDEAIEMVTNDNYNSKEYRKLIEDNYSLDRQLKELYKVIDSIDNSKKSKDIVNNIITFNYDLKEIKFYLPFINDHIQKIIYFNKSFYEIEMLEDIKKRIGENKVIIDVGANIGNHTIYFAKICRAKKVYSFEPQENIFNILVKNINLNNIDANVKAYNMGVGREHTYARIDVVDKNNYGSSRIIKNDKGEIEIDKLDNIMLNEVERVDMIKIDVEGMEMDVLEGAKGILEKFRPIIYIEAATDEEFNKVLDFLMEFNYKPIQRFNATPTYLFI